MNIRLTTLHGDTTIPCADFKVEHGSLLIYGPVERSQGRVVNEVVKAYGPGAWIKVERTT